MIIRGEAACIVTGIPRIHAAAFQKVADDTRSIILSRAVGRYATGLIEEGYASKGFHNKAKSCNWGPMAGFVLADPRFTKALEVDSQRGDLLRAFNDNAKEVPLFISEQRRRWLSKERIFVAEKVGDDYIGTATKELLQLRFRLAPARPVGATEPLWAVKYEGKNSMTAYPTVVAADEWVPVMAMRDPMCALSENDYRAATTGDYDLFAIWPRILGFHENTLDKRMVSNAVLESNIGMKKANTGEHKDLGNITPRIKAVRFHLNREFVRAGYTGGNMVHHSDEAGRPFVKDVDMPVFAVVPGQDVAYCMQNVADLRNFILNVVRNDYALRFNPGWEASLKLQQHGAYG